MDKPITPAQVAILLDALMAVRAAAAESITDTIALIDRIQLMAAAHPNDPERFLADLARLTG